MVGDPGLGKSQMLQAVCNLASRGIYVCGNSTSTAGLTVSLSRDAGTGDFSLEAGALVLADQGLCCIDEFDKLGSQQQALLEAMEQQSLDVSAQTVPVS
ncbi:DNA helicase MCM8 [Liparis tanakae]|uniref:DNA helicase MCM8 n=1 Tax=Liparis tanakae TaxID=230148 RepID=A0A4Z2ICV3_9TELE|nr:DNA helicase MCM8 [Liparis tanakae]